MKTRIAFLVSILVILGCEKKGKILVTNSGTLVTNFEKYEGKWVSTNGYFHVSEGRLDLLPSEEYSRLPQMGRDLSKLIVLIDEEHRAELVSACSNKISHVVGLVTRFSGVPAIKVKNGLLSCGSS